MKCKYRVRSFSSKGAFLVLLWTLLVFIVCGSLYYLFDKNDDHFFLGYGWLVSIPVLIVLVCTPLSGWLADAKFGNYKVFIAGAVLLFISTAINCLLLILETLIWEENIILRLIELCLGYSLFAVGACACIVTALPLGLDQMPDASASSITSYIAWFVCSIYIGGFIGKGLHIECFDKTVQPSYLLVWAFILTLCIGVVLISNFLFTPKWLIIEPKSPQSLKTIYRVLKFAAKHKAPINRSAFTYWEEDIPSRIDLGKSKYGGPFTTEQVEDVKTILRLLAINLSFSLIILSLFLRNDYRIKSDELLPGLPTCQAKLLLFLAFSFSEYGILGTFAYEFIFHPLVGNRYSSILKRIGTVFSIITLVTFLYFILKLVHYLSKSSETEWAVNAFYYPTSGILFQVLLTSMLEFICAQSPYNMRGLLVSAFAMFVFLSATVGSNFRFHIFCKESFCSPIIYSVETVICLIGFLLFCVVARWYKKRVRDEDYSPQRVVEEVYDRYLTAAAAQTSQDRAHVH